MTTKRYEIREVYFVNGKQKRRVIGHVKARTSLEAHAAADKAGITRGIDRMKIMATVAK